VSSIAVGSALGVFSGDIANLTSDIQALRPHSMSAAPRIFNKIAAKVNVGLQGLKPLQKYVCELAMHSKKKVLEAEGRHRSYW